MAGPAATERWAEAFVGGALCLDFANTVGGAFKDRSASRLAGYDDLLSWSCAAGSLSASEAAALARRAAADPRRAAGLLARAVELREALYRIFSALAGGATPAPADIERLNRVLRAALRHLQLAPRESAFDWRWSAAADDLARPLWPVARSAADLLTGPELALLRECDRCCWLFLDRSKNRRRRWCSMEVCGNRAKSQRHYSRRTKRGAKKDG